jgi:hypothetical protein
MKYLLLFCGSDDQAREYAALTPEQLGERFNQVGAWMAANGPRILGHGRLQSPETATTVRFPLGDGAPVVTDGPFLEGKESIGGYCEVEVEDLDEALRLAKSWPGRGTVEVRPGLAP